MILALYEQALRRPRLGQVPVGPLVVGVVAEDFLVDGNGVVQQAGRAVARGGVEKVANRAGHLTGFQAQVAHLVDHHRVILVDLQDLLVDGDRQYPVLLLAGLVGFLFQLAELGQEEPRNEQ